jgi:hypothetical protein
MARVYIQEVVDVVGTERRRYQEHVTTTWGPVARETRRQRCYGVFTLVGSTGRWPQVVNLWEFDSWGDLAADLEFELSGLGHRDPDLDEWWTTAADLRSGGEDRILIAHDDAPGVGYWMERGGTGSVAYVHETLRVPPGEAAETLEVVVGPAAEDHAAFGLGLVGAFRTAMVADDEVIAIWGVPDWAAWAAYEEAAAGGGLEFLRLWERVSGRVRDRRRVLLVDAEHSPLRTGVQPGE